MYDSNPSLTVMSRVNFSDDQPFHCFFYQGMVGEFKVPNSGMMGHYDEVALQKSWCFVNGFFGLLLCFGLLMTALKTTSAHTWRYGSGWYVFKR